MRTCNSCRRRNKVSAHQEVKNTVVRRSLPQVDSNSFIFIKYDIDNTMKEKVVKEPIVEPKVEPVVPVSCNHHSFIIIETSYSTNYISSSFI